MKASKFFFQFSLRGKFHYKNPLCVGKYFAFYYTLTHSVGFVELDKRLGDINGDIIDHENRILSRLSGFICKYNKNIREPLKVIGLMDWQVVLIFFKITLFYYSIPNLLTEIRVTNKNTILKLKWESSFPIFFIRADRYILSCSVC